MEQVAALAGEGDAEGPALLRGYEGLLPDVERAGQLARPSGQGEDAGEEEARRLWQKVAAQRNGHVRAADRT